MACNASRVAGVQLPCLVSRCFALGGSLPAGLAGATALQVIDLAGNQIGEFGCGGRPWGLDLECCRLDWLASLLPRACVTGCLADCSPAACTHAE